MPSKKKLQVFVSSTYTDLLEERQAAVQAILTAGHIPAGMELFAAGDEAQMDVIKRWIDESDVYMLILGGRYGSIEPKSQKSYIQLEYEYAVETGKPLFAVVVDENYLEKKAKKKGLKIIERDHPDKLKAFRAHVESKMVRFWSDPKDIKLAILETMAEFTRREDLVGWVQGDEAINTGVVAEEMARLAKENATLREQITNASSVQFNGLTFEQLYDVTNSFIVDVNLMANDGERWIEKLTEFVNTVDDKPTLIHYFWMMRSALTKGFYDTYHILKLEELGLIQRETREENISNTFKNYRDYFYLSEMGKRFLLRLRLDKNFSAYEKYIVE
jgi:hypothetical protein